MVLSACLGVKDADLDTASNHRSSVHIKEAEYMIVLSGDRRVPKLGVPTKRVAFLYGDKPCTALSM